MIYTNNIMQPVSLKTNTTSGINKTIISLPLDILLNLCLYLDMNSLCKLSGVTRTCDKFANDDWVWGKIINGKNKEEIKVIIKSKKLKIKEYQKKYMRDLTDVTLNIHKYNYIINRSYNNTLINKQIINTKEIIKFIEKLKKFVTNRVLIGYPYENTLLMGQKLLI